MSQIKKEFPIGSLLSARQFYEPKLFNDKVYFISNLIGHYSLYEMRKEGSVPIPILPETISLTNPVLFHGTLIYEIVPKLEKILIIIDEDGNELFQPYLVSLTTGGVPERLFGDEFSNQQINLLDVDTDNNIAFFAIDDRKSPGYELIGFNLENRDSNSLGKTPNGLILAGYSKDYRKILALEIYGSEDQVFYLINNETDRELYIGQQPKNRSTDYKKFSIESGYFVENGYAYLALTHLISDSYGIIRIENENPHNYLEIPIHGILHKGLGILEKFTKVSDSIFILVYNIDGVSYVYLTEYMIEQETRYLKVIKQLVGFDSPISNGVLLGIGFDKEKFLTSKRRIPEEFVISLTKSLMPSQIFLINTNEISNEITKLTDERVVGIPEEYLSEGESSNYKSFDGLEISARLYRPSEKLSYKNPRPLVVYVHGGPTTQERPAFTNLSTAIIQFLTLNGFSVFVPNVRGSTGYGKTYMNQVNRDWGGKDLKDHLEGLKSLENDKNIDSTKRFVMGRSYGGFMTLSLLTRHPDLWAGGCDMFGMYDLIGFYSRLPETWQKTMVNLFGDPSKEEEKEYFLKRSPKTFINNIKAPLLVIQGRNDPRILAKESEEIVNDLKKAGKLVELTIYEDEGHDVAKIENKIDCYEKITSFFLKHS
ncbi:MAG: alpha/beta hydrolase family protein [Candidatus Hodarchaeales archaeon]|jgi:esterase/lipase